ncbi:MAG: ATP-binding protein [Bacteroidota bacterium]
MKDAMLSQSLKKPLAFGAEGNTRALYYALFIPLACMLFLLEWEPRVFVFVFLAYSAGIIGFLTARQFLKKDQMTTEQDLLYRLMAENTADILILHRMEDNSNVYVSPSIKALGYAPDEIICKYGTYLLHPDDRRKLVQRLKLTKLQQNDSFLATLRVRNKDKSYVWMELKGKAIKDEQGQITHTLLALRDVSSRKELETVNSHLAAELLRKQEASTRTVEMGQLAAIMASHDLKEPLRTIQSYAELLEQKYKPQLEAPAQDCVHYIRDGAERMQRMLKDIRAFASLEGGQAQLGMVDLNGLLEEVLMNLNTRILESDAVISYETLPQLPVDARQLRHLLQNLIENAIKYSGDRRPYIHLSWQKSHGSWQFKLQDNGIGIKEEFQHTVFDIFRRLHGVGQYEGSGLGLAICKQIIDNHGGKIWVESEGEGQGCSFYFSIPIDSAQQPLMNHFYKADLLPAAQLSWSQS